MYFTKPPVEYGTTTHDLELAFSQTPENRGKITEYTAAFPSEINASHYVPAESDIIRLPVELGNEKISYNKDIVLLLGDTGVGKSTLLYYITGAELDVKNANISGERTSILKSNGHFSRSKISHDTPAKTKFPNFYEHEGIIYLDCPGLGDTNRYEKDQLFELSENAKVVLLLSEENLSDKGEKFIALLSKLKHLLGNFDDVKDALSFVITKASLGYDIQNFRAWINNTVIPQQNHTGFTTEFHEKMLSHLSSEDSRIGLFLKHDESSFINDIIKLNLKIIKENINASTAARGLKVQFELSNESKVIGKELVKHIETYLSKRSDNSINITLNTTNTPKDQQAHKELKIIENLKKYLTFREQIIKNQQMFDTFRISASDTEFFDKIEHLNHDSDIIDLLHNHIN
ncbi:GTPase [Candidatus Lariskella endosymbiont of Epinotia ramella]|uniref:GTPase n=1 Tax=Candidatus Lariskella endosymbiont of Epinotia ramella TaxID=3066224 RepID=UPI0030D03C57